MKSKQIKVFFFFKFLHVVIWTKFSCVFWQIQGGILMERSKERRKDYQKRKSFLESCLEKNHMGLDSHSTHVIHHYKNRTQRNNDNLAAYIFIRRLQFMIWRPGPGPPGWEWGRRRVEGVMHWLWTNRSVTLCRQSCGNKTAAQQPAVDLKHSPVAVAPPASRLRRDFAICPIGHLTADLVRALMVRPKPITCVRQFCPRYPFRILLLWTLTHFINMDMRLAGVACFCCVVFRRERITQPTC